jgi:two-component system chemotaxis response regulator CheB
VAATVPLLAIGGSAGSFTPLMNLVSALPADLPAAVLICQHISDRGRSHLPDILARRTRLPVAWATDLEPLQPGRIFVAPPGRHLLAHPARARLSTGPRVNRHRPSIDVLFASAAETAGPATSVVVLSGVLDDGAVGAALVDLVGGRVWAEDPATAEFASMPRATLAAAPSASIMTVQAVVDDVLAAADGGPSGEVPVLATGAERKDEMQTATPEEDPGFLRPGESRLTRLVCPECGGGLAQVDLPQISYFRCHVGHQYGPQSLAAAQAETSEQKLWSAVAAMEEQVMVQGYLEAIDASREAAPPITGTYRSSARELASRAAALKERVQRWTSDSDQADRGGSD